MMNVKLISVTPDCEKIIAYCARVSNPDNQDNPNIEKLLKYCSDREHWSVFEMGNMIIEVTTTRAISAQILRHKSFSFQEFSTRYSPVQNLIYPVARRQDKKNRQNSIDDLSSETIEWWQTKVESLFGDITTIYQEALDRNIAKECARFILPLSAETKLYINGNIRSWITYLKVRANPKSGTQKEHFEIACQIKEIFKEQLPIIYGAFWDD